MFWSYYCTKFKKWIVFVGFMTVITPRLYSNFAKKGAELVYLYRNFLFKQRLLHFLKLKRVYDENPSYWDEQEVPV